MKFQDIPIDDPMKRCPDISAARDLLQWEPQVAFEDGLGKTIEYFRARIENSAPR